jgi:effector-binding domain-containing protein
MLKIGVFSKLSRISIQTLRYYDDLGLLKPLHVDPSSGYRFYASSQLAQLHRILALKDMGLSLEQIARLLKQGLPPEQLRGMLRLKQVEIEQHVQAEQERLSRLEARLKQMEQETEMSNYDVILKTIEALPVASIRQKLESYSASGQLFTELYGCVMASGSAHPAGPAMAIWHDHSYRETDIDAEALLPLDGTLKPTGRIQVYTLPEARMACTLHQGPMESVGAAYEAIMRWIEAGGYTITGPNREVYLHWPEAGEDPSAALVEIQFPVESARPQVQP